LPVTDRPSLDPYARAPLDSSSTSPRARFYLHRRGRGV